MLLPLLLEVILISFDIVERKTKKMHRSKSVDLFNSIINTLGLREIYMSGGKYTWTNNQAHPTLEKLDRILMSEDWEDMYPLVSV